MYRAEINLSSTFDNRSSHISFCGRGLGTRTVDTDDATVLGVSGARKSGDGGASTPEFSVLTLLN